MTRSTDSQINQQEAGRRACFRVSPSPEVVPLSVGHRPGQAQAPPPAQTVQKHSGRDGVSQVASVQQTGLCAHRLERVLAGQKGIRCGPQCIDVATFVTTAVPPVSY